MALGGPWGIKIPMVGSNNSLFLSILKAKQPCTFLLDFYPFRFQIVYILNYNIYMC